MIYCMSKKCRLILYSNFLYGMRQAFLDIQYQNTYSTLTCRFDFKGLSKKSSPFIYILNRYIKMNKTFGHTVRSHRTRRVNIIAEYPFGHLVGSFCIADAAVGNPKVTLYYVSKK